MACACGKNKSNQQTSAQAVVRAEATPQEQQSAQNAIANTARVRRG